MKKTLIIVCMMSAMCALGAAQKPSAKKTGLSESELRTLAKDVPDEKKAGMLYSVAMATTNDVNRKQEYLKIAAACLFACDKIDVYKKYVKGKLLNAEDVEDELKDECKKCSGTGMRKRQCYVCNGKGQCATCKGSGMGVSVGFDRSEGRKRCVKCNGTGHCHKCEGTGLMEEKCLTCSGTGKMFSKVVATRVFRDSCNALADDVDVVATSNNADVNTRVDFERQRTERQNAVGEQSQHRSRRGRKEGDVRTSEALPTSSGHQMDNKILDQLEALRRNKFSLYQYKYSLKEVISAGKALLLLTSKIPYDATRDTPFWSNNEMELKKNVLAAMKSAQTLLSDIESNGIEISTGEFNPDDYSEYWHNDTTEIRKRRLFDEVWEKALYSPHLKRDANNNPLGKLLLSKVPDNIVFVVNDVSLIELNGGGEVYCVQLTALAFGKKDYTLGTVWNGRECQTRKYIELAEKTGALAHSPVKLLVPTSHGDVEEWKKGDTVISKGWLNYWTIFNAVRTYDNGRKEEYREITMPGEMIRSLRDLVVMDIYGSVSKHLLGKPE